MLRYYAMLMRHVATTHKIVVMTDEARNEVYAVSGAQKRYPGYVVDKVKEVTRESYDQFNAASNKGPAPHTAH
jgi:hypothetical protein